MTVRHPPPGDPPLHRWGSREIAACIRAANPTGPLPEPGQHARPLIIEPRPLMAEATPATTTDWTGTAACNHRRDEGIRPSPACPALADLTANQRRILTVLAALDARAMPGGTALRLCVNRRRLKASAGTMQELDVAGLFIGAGSRDP
jgi:hypothetical protein